MVYFSQLGDKIINLEAIAYIDTHENFITGHNAYATVHFYSGLSVRITAQEYEQLKRDIETAALLVKLQAQTQTQTQTQTQMQKDGGKNE